jgi:membrane protein implicated in regulation of membrane protease activity
MSNKLERLYLFPIGTTLVVSTLALLLFPGVATIACEFFTGLTLIGIVLFRKVFRYVNERRDRSTEQSVAGKRSLDRSDVLLLLAFAAVYAAFSGMLVSAGWSINAVRSCGFLLLMIAVLIKPRLAAWRRDKIGQDDRPQSQSAIDARSI